MQRLVLPGNKKGWEAASEELFVTCLAKFHFRMGSRKLSKKKQRKFHDRCIIVNIYANISTVTSGF